MGGAAPPRMDARERCPSNERARGFRWVACTRNGMRFGCYTRPRCPRLDMLVSYWTLACLARKLVGIELQHLSLSSKSCPVQGLEKPNNTHHAALPPEPRNKRALTVAGGLELNPTPPTRGRTAEAPHHCQNHHWAPARNATDAPSRRRRPREKTREKRSHAPRDEPAPQILVRPRVPPVQGEEAQGFLR